MILKELLNIIDYKQKIVLVYKNNDGELEPIETVIDNIAKTFTKQELINDSYEICNTKNVFVSNGVLVIELD